VFTVSIVFWIVYFISVALFTQASNGSTTSVFFNIIAYILDFSAEAIVAGCILWLVDRRGGIINLFRFFTKGVPIQSGTSTTRATSTPALPSCVLRPAILSDSE